MAIDNSAVANMKWVGGLVAMVAVAVGAAWSTRDFADERAKEVVAAFKDALRHHEGSTHEHSVRRDDYERDLAMIQTALVRIDDKLDKLVLRIPARSRPHP